MPLYMNDKKNSDIKSIITHPHFIEPDIIVQYASKGAAKKISENFIASYVKKHSNPDRPSLCTIGPELTKKIMADFPLLFQ